MVERLEDYSKEELLTLVKNLKSRKKYGLVWEDKPEAVATMCADNLPVLFEVEDRALLHDPEGKTNLIIEGDNFHTLSVLNYTHAGQIDVIYIDPPYNTGSQDFVYNDVFVDAEDTYRHSKWLSFMEKRLRLAQKLLTEDGSLFVSIDDNEYPRLVMLLELIFGEKNVKTISLKMSEATGVKMSSVLASGRIPKLKEYLVIAKKDGIRNLHIDKLPKESWDDEYKTLITNATADEVSEVKQIRDNEQRTNEDLERLDAIVQSWTTETLSRYFQKNPTSKREQLEFRYQNAWRIVQIATLTGGARDLAINKKKKIKNPDGFFSITTSQKKCYLISGNFNDETSLSRCKILFADDYLTIHPGDFWSDIKTTGLDNEGGVEFRNGKKPLKLLERIVKTNTRKDIVVLDFFAGSGTTGHAVLKLNSEDGGNRTFILGTNNENGIAEDVTYERIRGAVDGRGKTPGISANVRYFKTDFVSREATDDQTRAKLVERSQQMIAIREGTFAVAHEQPGLTILKSADSYSAVVYDQDAIPPLIDFFNKSGDSKHVNIYVFSLSNDNYASDFSTLTRSFDLRPIPEGLLAVYRRVFDSGTKSLGQ